MAHSSYQVGHSTNRPPLLFGSENYYIWHFCMKIFLQRDPKEWDAVENGYTIPMKSDGTPKRVKEFTQEEMNSHSYNYRAMYTLICGMVQSEIDKIIYKSCNTAKEIWDTLKNIHIGTSKNRRIKLNSLMQDYDDFRVEKDESILEAQARFLTLLNSLALLDKRFPQSEINGKLLLSMPKRFAPKVDSMQICDTTYTMDTITLFGKLEEYEHRLQRYDQDEAFRKKNIDLDSDVEDIDKEISLLIKELFNKRKNHSKKAGEKRKNKAHEALKI